MDDGCEAHSKRGRLLDESAPMCCAECADSEVSLSERSYVVNPENWKALESLRTFRAIHILDKPGDFNISNVRCDIRNLRRERTRSKNEELHAFTIQRRSC